MYFFRSSTTQIFNPKRFRLRTSKLRSQLLQLWIDFKDQEWSEFPKKKTTLLIGLLIVDWIAFILSLSLPYIPLPTNHHHQKMIISFSTSIDLLPGERILEPDWSWRVSESDWVSPEIKVDELIWLILNQQLVILSYLISWLGAYTSSALIAHANSSFINPSSILHWTALIALSSITFGLIGIWSLHFLGESLQLLQLLLHSLIPSRLSHSHVIDAIQIDWNLTSSPLHSSLCCGGYGVHFCCSHDFHSITSS